MVSYKQRAGARQDEPDADEGTGIWIVDPLSMLDVVREHLHAAEDDGQPAREESYFAGARLCDDELRSAAAEDREQRAAVRDRHAEAVTSNLGLGHDIRARLADPTPEQLDAVRAIVCRLLARVVSGRDRLRRGLDRPRAPASRRTPAVSSRGTPTRS